MSSKKFYKLVNSDQFKVEFKLNPGDMIVWITEEFCMDGHDFLRQRRKMLRGCYLERDELQSALRVVRRDVGWNK